MPELKRRPVGIAEGEPIPGGGGDFPEQLPRERSKRARRARAYDVLAKLPRRKISEEQKGKIRRRARYVWGWGMPYNRRLV